MKHYWNLLRPAFISNRSEMIFSPHTSYKTWKATIRDATPVLSHYKIKILPCHVPPDPANITAKNPKWMQRYINPPILSYTPTISPPPIGHPMPTSSEDHSSTNTPPATPPDSADVPSPIRSSHPTKSARPSDRGKRVWAMLAYSFFGRKKQRRRRRSPLRPRMERRRVALTRVVIRSLPLPRVAARRRLAAAVAVVVRRFVVADVAVAVAGVASDEEAYRHP
mmetsp:Transcript_18304/g.28654  ORF Transcript_18304/g.28654 Transcript_18304/m.28654 type:complete len:223 (-) Transcript_18304:263-931(-)